MTKWKCVNSAIGALWCGGTTKAIMSDEEDKPPAPPVRLTSNNSFRGVRGDPPPPHHHYAPSPVDLKPLPKEPEPEERTGKKHSKSAKHSGAPKGSRSTRRPEAEKPVISNPTNFEHTVHVGFDAHTGEFTGMPEAWARLLMSSNISKLEQKKNPQAVLDVLNWFDNSTKEAKGSKYMTTTRMMVANTCPLCQSLNHDVWHLFSCPSKPTTLDPTSLWTDPVVVAKFLDLEMEL
ncbi:hypothetical protein M8J77_018608 [Diaphorina citri]|nr:hypothetical protein M8J77_018608 [Diaphorina citri]